MRVKRFYGKDSTTALNAVKAAFGKDAVVLETVRHPEAEVGAQIEILAAVDYDPTLNVASRVLRETPMITEKKLPQRVARGGFEEVKTGVGLKSANDDFICGEANDSAVVKPEYDRLRQELSLVKGMMGRLLVGSGLNEGWSQPCFTELLAQLLSRKVSSEIAHELLTQAYAEVGTKLPVEKDEEYLRSLVKAVLARQLMQRVEILSGTRMSRIITLVGPTGVGKTTTLAKLAARFRACGERVALISVDTYRLGAAEQISEYGRRLKVPVEIVKERRELLAALNSFAGFDRILVDTMGRSAKDRDGLAALYRLLKGLKGDTLMVLPAALQEEDLLENLVHFRAFNCRALLFTKLDETQCYGSILNALSFARLPLSFFTDGQQVPDDLETASGERLADLLLDIV